MFLKALGAGRDNGNQLSNAGILGVDGLRQLLGFLYTQGTQPYRQILGIVSFQNPAEFLHRAGSSPIEHEQQHDYGNHQGNRHDRKNPQSHTSTGSRVLGAAIQALVHVIHAFLDWGHDFFDFIVVLIPKNQLPCQVLFCIGVQGGIFRADLPFGDRGRHLAGVHPLRIHN